MLTELAVILVLILVNGVFAGAEIAVVALRKSRVIELTEQRRRGALATLVLRNDMERFLATVQVGITIVSAAAAAFGGASIAAELAELLRGFPWFSEHAEGLALALVIAGVSYFSIVLGELVPKSLALRAAERYALLAAGPLLTLSWLAKPLVWFLTSSANVLLRAFGDRTTFSESRHSPEELQALMEEAGRTGTLRPEVGEIASRALELPTLTASDVMVPRGSVVGVARDASRDDIRRILLEHPYSRLPVYDGTIDNVIGYVTVKDVLALAWEGDLLVLSDIVRPPYFVPQSKPALDLINEMRRQHTPLAIVLDEHGGTAGVVTLEDLVEELVGEIYSEHVSRPAHTIRPEPDGTVVVSGTTPLRELNRALELTLPDDGQWTTVAGLFLGLAGRMPRVGESVVPVQGVELVVTDASPRRIRAIRVLRRPTEAHLDGPKSRRGN